MYGKIIDGNITTYRRLPVQFEDESGLHLNFRNRRAVVANAVLDAYKVNTVSTQHTDNIHNSGKFTKASVPKKV